MNPDVKAKWVAALRSGAYEQGKHSLRTSKDEYCCLGVLCEVAQREGVDVSAHRDSFGWYYGGEAGILPESVRTWAGLPDTNPALPRGQYSEYTLADINDSLGYTFDQIADLVETYL